MIDPGPVAARASLEVARTALGRMISTGPGIAARAPSVTMAVRATEAWAAVEHVLHNVTGRVELTGPALLAEARRQERLTLDDANAIDALSDRVSRMTAPGAAAHMLTLPPTEAERDAATNALVALEHAVNSVSGGAVTESDMKWAPPVPVPEPFAPPPLAPSQDARGFAPPPSTPARETIPPTPAFVQPVSVPPVTAGNYRSPNAVNDFGNTNRQTGIATTETGSTGSSAAIVGVLLVVVLVLGGGAWYLLRDKGIALPGTSSANAASTEEGIAAYTRGSRETARLAFTRALEKNPSDARAMTYLGRISRDLGEPETARKYLENAIRIEPENALALRELGSALLASKQPELARRFYVRALTVDKNDRVAQGFLACALQQLNRVEEAQRWYDRAGPGDWSVCAVPATQR